MWKYAVGLLALAAVACAWLPNTNKAITANDDRDFSNSAGNMNSIKRWLPDLGKIWGVNLGSLFVFEPWLATSM